MHNIIHVLNKRTKRRQPEKKKHSSIIDNAAYVMGAVSVGVNMPQLIAVWTAPDISGVSLLSWAGFFVGSLFWLAYGIVHKEKPIVVINGALCFVNILVVTGIISRNGLVIS